MITPQQAIEAIDERFGRHPRRRALHAKGTLARGTFTATPAAAALTRAVHMQGARVPVTARLSNGSGDPGTPDYAPDVRGLAVGFHLPGGERTDISAQTAPRFPFRDPDAFIAFLRASTPGAAVAVRLPLHLARRPRALRGLRANLASLRPPASFASRPYYAFHAFRWLDAGGGERHVRYTWRPTVELADLSVAEARSRGRDYLFDDLAERLASGPVRFELELQLAAPGDPIDDPSARWPEDRERVHAGSLELTASSADGDELVFDPTRLTDGIEPSGDPVLRFRPRAYALSHERRSG